MGDKKQPGIPWYESNLLWVPFSLGTGFVLAVVPAMKHDLRWLLWLAGPCFIISGCLAARRLKALLRWTLTPLLVVFVCGGLYWLNVWLRPAEDHLRIAQAQQNTPEQPTPDKNNPPAQQTPASAPPSSNKAKKDSGQSATVKGNGSNNTAGNIGQNGNNNTAVVGNGNTVSVSPSPEVIADAVVKRLGPPVKGGFHEVVKEITVSLGSVSAIMSADAARRGTVPFFMGGLIPVRLHFQDDQMLFTFESWDAGLPIKVDGNQVTIGNNLVDRNFGENAFELVNTQGEPLFQMIRKNAGSLQINGIFPTGKISQLTGKPVLLWVSESGGVGKGSIRPANFHLEPIFKYPAWKYPGVYADNPPTVTQQPPMSQQCAPGADCAMSNNQQGGITANKVYIGIDQRIPDDKKPGMIAILSRKTAVGIIALAPGGNTKLAYDWYDVLKAAGWSTGDSLGGTSLAMKGITLGLGPLLPKDGNFPADSPEGELLRAAEFSNLKGLQIGTSPIGGSFFVFVGTDP